MKQVAVVICNFNKKDFVLDCIKSVFDSSFTDFDLIVVDNASTDGSAEAIRERYGDELTLLVNAENTGGSGGFSRGMTYAMKRGYKYIHLLDNDVVIDKNAIGALYDFMENHAEAGACGSLIYRMDEKTLIQEYGAMVDIDKLGIRPLYHNTFAKETLPEHIECDYVAACSAMYRSSVLRETGVIDEEFFIYWDDIALSLSIGARGYKVYALKKSNVWHYRGLAEATSTFGIYYFFRNKIYCFAKYANNSDFERLAEILTVRLFRTSLVNLNNPEIVMTYFNALDDALNNVRGKADASKILPIPLINDGFKNYFSDKKKILLYCKCEDFNVNQLVRRLRLASGAAISIYANGYEMPKIDDVENLKKFDEAVFDVIIIMCPHVLDVSFLDRKYVYLDKYMNQILTDADFEQIAGHETAKKFFMLSFGGFIKYKLDGLRHIIRGDESGRHSTYEH